MGDSSHIFRFFISLIFSALLIYGDLSLSLFADLRGGMSLVLTPFRAAAELPAKSYTAARDYIRNREALLREKAELEATIRENDVRLNSLDFFVRQNIRLREMLNLRARAAGAGSDYAAAGLLRDFSHPLSERVLLDKGLGDEIFPCMAVVDGGGVLGQVVRADLQTSVVNLITDRGQWLTARARRNNLLVLLRGDGGGLLIEYVPNSADLQVGDELVAAGGVYPSGYPVAVVSRAERGEVYMDAAAAPLSTFSDNDVVLVYLGGGQEEDAAAAQCGERGAAR